MKRRQQTTEKPSRVLWDEAAGRGSVAELGGDWKVQRLSGPVPMPGVYKEIRGGRGRTWARWSPFPALPFRLEGRENSVMLVYRPPLSGIRDELRRQDDGSWLGRTTIAGLRYAWFRMVPDDDPRGGT